MAKRYLGVLALVFAAATANAQDFKPPMRLFAVAAAADWATTHKILSVPGERELNPMLKFTKSRPTPTVIAGIAYDTAGVWAWSKFVGKRHLKIAKVGLYAMAGVRGYIVFRNIRILKEIERRGLGK